jgi:hypothetical protein
MTTVLEALQNAQINLTTVGSAGANRHPIFAVAMGQLSNAIEALENGCGPEHVLQDGLGADVNTKPEARP